MAVCATLLGAAGARSQVPTSDIVTMLPSPQGALGGTFYPESISSSGLITGYYGSSGHNGTRYRTVIANVAGGSVVVEDAGYQGGNLDPNDANYNGEESWGFGINAGGAGTGSSYQGAASISYFSGYPIDGLSNGPNPPPGTSPRDVEMGTAINNSGMITGVAEQVDSSGNTNVHAVVFQNGTWTDLGANLPYISGAYGVSTTGTVVGFQTTTGQYANVLLAANQGKVATEWNQSANGTWAATSLGTLPGAAAGAQTMAFGVNTEGQVVGVSDNANGGDDATLWQPNGSGGFTAINLNPVVSGKTGSSGTLANPVLQPGGILSPAFMQDNPLTNVLGTNVSSCAESINNLGQVVGFTYAGNYGRQAFLATVSGTTATMVTLNSLLPANMQQANGGPWDLEEATSINDLGQIVGWGSYDSPTNGYENVGFEFTLSQQSAWANSSGDYWENTSNWTGSVPNAPCATAIFSDAQGLTAPGTIIMQYDKTVGHLTFNSVNSYTISSPTGARLIIDDTNDISGTTPSIIVAAGSHTINVPVVLATNNGSGGLAINTFPGTTLTLNSSVTAGNTTANPLTLTPITLTGAGSVVVSQTGSIGVPLILDNASITFGARVNFNQSGGNGILVRNVPSITFPNQVGDPNSTDTYTVGEGSEAQLTLALASSSTSRQVLVTSALNFYSVNTDPTDPTNSAALAGKIDLGNNDMIVLNGNIANINQALKEGYNAGAQSAQAPYPNTNWTGSGLDQGFQQDGIGVDDGNSLVAGILSSAAAADTTHLTALGGIQNVNAAGKAIYAIFDTVSVSSSDVLVKYTYYGDANLDGQVDGSDYSLIDYAYTYNQKNPSAPLTGWYNGDFNYDGVTDGSDYTLIDNAFNQQGAAINAAVATVTAQIGGVSTSAVPEPAALGALAMAAARLLGRRSRGVASKAF
jgi:probable HAF family extracellular repeat protein